MFFSSADVSITLRNRGEDAFKPDLYGETITVNQHINLEGHRSYKLKSSTGWVIFYFHLNVYKSLTNLGGQNDRRLL